MLFRCDMQIGMFKYTRGAAYQGTIELKAHPSMLFLLMCAVGYHGFFFVIQFCYYCKWTGVIVGNFKDGIHFLFFPLSFERGSKCVLFEREF
jgi:hypothetical protein